MIATTCFHFITCGQKDSTIIDSLKGYVYKTVKIGNQEWLAENLRTSVYNNGTPIDKVLNDTIWSNLSTGAYCWYNNDSVTYENMYGKLYNWYAINTGNLCPIGWHIPSYAEWKKLTNYLGGDSIAGGKLKEKGTTHWQNPDIEATNESGFTALPGGGRYFGGAFYSIGNGGYWWSSTEGSTINAWYWGMSYFHNSIHIEYDDKKFGLSVRCLKD
ncbi:FISUMP domain-containing protein [Bacteroidota bacterium]